MPDCTLSVAYILSVLQRMKPAAHMAHDPMGKYGQTRGHPCLCGGPGQAAEPDRRGRAPSGKDRSRAASPSRAAEPQPSHVTHDHMASHASTVTRGDTGKSDPTATVRHLQACA